jgi:hypothetical protein
MRNVVLCRNFSGGAFVSRSLRTREIRTSQPKSAEGDVRGRIKTSGLNEAAWQLNDFDVRTLSAEFETDVE